MSVLGANLSCRCEVERLPAKETRILNLESACGAFMRACCSAVCLDQWRDGLGRGSESLGTCHIIETLSVAWDAPCSPIRRFESELCKTALAGYAARNLLPLSLEGARSRLGPFPQCWLYQAGQLDAAQPDSVRAAGSRRTSSCPTLTRCSLCWSVSLRRRVSFCRHYHFCAAYATAQDSFWVSLRA